MNLKSPEPPETLVKERIPASSPPVISQEKESLSGSVTLIFAINLVFSSTEISSGILNSGASSTFVTVIWTLWEVLLNPSSAKTDIS